jgi:hypothetical protein
VEANLILIQATQALEWSVVPGHAMELFLYKFGDWKSGSPGGLGPGGLDSVIGVVLDI